MTVGAIGWHPDGLSGRFSPGVIFLPLHAACEKIPPSLGVRRSLIKSFAEDLPNGSSSNNY